MTDVERPPLTWDFRRQTMISVQSVLRIMCAAMEAFGDDLECIVIFFAAAASSVEAAMRSAELTGNPPPGAIPADRVRPISRRGIAASTGLPRETVRRKIAVLVEQGLLVQDGPQVHMRPGILDDPVNLAFAHVLVGEFRRTGERLRQMAAAETKRPRR